MIIGSPVPFLTKRQNSLNLVSGPTNYPIGINADNLMYYIRNVAALDVGITLEIFGQEIQSPPSDLIGALNALDNGLQSLTTFILGKTNRTCTQNTKIDKNFIPTNLPYSIPFIDAPKFTKSDFGGSFVLDLNDILYLDGLYYPKLIIDLTYASSNGAGDVAGGIKLGNIGIIPIYYVAGSSPLGINDSIFIDGNININSTFDTLISPKISYQVNETISLSSEQDLDLTKYNVAYFGGQKVDIISSDDSNLTLPAPPNPYRGPIQISSDNPYDLFYTVEEYQIE